MRRRPTFAALAALCSLALVFAGCGDDDDGGEEASDTSTTTEAETSTTAPAAAEVDCDAYGDLVTLIANIEDIATGASESQELAQEELAEHVEALGPAAEGDEELTGALDTLSQVSFQVSETPEGPAPGDVDAALDTIEGAWSETCPGEDAGPTTEPEGQPDGESGAGEDTGSGEGDGSEPADPEATVPECPAPEVLEAEGFSCDSEGNLTPLDEETVTECPAPEVLEAEGYTCDSEGNLTPIE